MHCLGILRSDVIGWSDQNMEVDGNSKNQVISGYVAKIYSVLLDQFEFNLTGKQEPVMRNGVFSSYLCGKNIFYTVSLPMIQFE